MSWRPPRDGAVTGRAVGASLRLSLHYLDRGECDDPNCALPSFGAAAKSESHQAFGIACQRSPDFTKHRTVWTEIQARLQLWRGQMKIGTPVRRGPLYARAPRSRTRVALCFVRRDARATMETWTVGASRTHAFLATGIAIDRFDRVARILHSRQAHRRYKPAWNQEREGWLISDAMAARRSGLPLAMWLVDS